jgi:hypothetical protein
MQVQGNWQRPGPNDEVLVTYIARQQGHVIEASKGARLVQLGQGLLPPGLEKAIQMRFTKEAEGVVTIDPSQQGAFMCVCVCVYTYTDTYTCTYIYTYTYTYIHTHKHIHTYINMCTGYI